MEPTTESLTAVLDSIRQLASTASSLNAFEDEVVKVISQQLPHYDWVGFYMLDPNDPGTLVLGPFVGESTPHVRIPVDQGICGAAVASRSTIVVDDVNADPRYLSCSIKTRSEIVVPIFSRGKVVGELDIDSHTLAAFTNADRAFLEEVAGIVGSRIQHRPK
ncbi:MAG TPA: GAF domain-containing protein [Bryobacteraceae bacterium]|nr:GAF domain-containing protein [Bryobacteraceae bacterium]